MQPNNPQQQPAGYGQQPYPQQPGYGQPYPQQPYGQAGASKAHAGAAGFAGVMGLLAGSALGWSIIEYFALGGVDQWPTGYWVIVGTRGVLALAMLAAGSLTLSRKIGGAWSLVLFGLLTAATLLLDPIVISSLSEGFVSTGDVLDSIFQFNTSQSGSVVVAAGLGLIAAIAAIFAAAMKSTGQQQYPGY